MNPTSNFSRRCSNCPKNKIVHNLLITKPNRMNQNFLWRKKYNLWEKIQIKNFKIQNCFCCPLSPVLSLFGYNFWSLAPIEKNNIPMKLIMFSIWKKDSKNHNKNSAHRYLPEIPFVPWRDNGPLGVKLLQIGSSTLSQKNINIGQKWISNVQ